MRWLLKPKHVVASFEEAEGASTEVSLVVAGATRCFSQHVFSSVLMWFIVLLMFCLWDFVWVFGFLLLRSSFLVLSCSLVFLFGCS